MKATPKTSLEEAWKNWEDCLNGNDTNSIFQQITTMIWDTGIFRIFLAARQSELKKNPQAPELNDALHSFIDRSYFQSQSVIIRRITDEPYPLTGIKGVYSLHALIKDIKSYRNELTRKTFFELKSMPYDYNELRRREEEYCLSQTPGKGFFIPPELQWHPIEEAHCTFDRLAGVTAHNRNPSDQVDSNVFCRLRDRLSVCTEISSYVDKFIAHSSTPDSRFIQNYNETTITLNHIWEAHRAIFEVANFLSSTLFDKEHMALAIEIPSFYMFWDKPLIEHGELDLIRNTFENYQKETETWRTEGIDDIWNALRENNQWGVLPYAPTRN